MLVINADISFEYKIYKTASLYGLINSFPSKPCSFLCLQYRYFENTMRKGEMVHNSPFPTVFFEQKWMKKFEFDKRNTEFQELIDLPSYISVS